MLICRLMAASTKAPTTPKAAASVGVATPQIDGAQDQKHQNKHRKQRKQPEQTHTPGRRLFAWRNRRLQPGRQVNNQHKHPGQQKPWGKPCQVEPPNGLFRQHAINDHGNTRRDENIQGPPCRQRPHHPAFVVATRQKGRQGHRSDRRRTGGAGAGDRPKHRTKGNIGMQEATANRRQPVGQDGIQALRHAAIQQDLPHHHKQRHGDQDKVAIGVPGHLPQHVQERAVRKEVHHGDANEPQGCRHMQPNGKKYRHEYGCNQQ